MTQEEQGLLPSTVRLFELVPSMDSPDFYYHNWQRVAQIREDYINWKITPLQANTMILEHTRGVMGSILRGQCDEGNPEAILFVDTTLGKLK